MRSRTWLIFICPRMRLPIIIPNHHQDGCYLSICVSSTGQALSAIRHLTTGCESCIIGLGKLLLWVEVGLLSVSQGYTQLYFCSTRHNGQQSPKISAYMQGTIHKCERRHGAQYVMHVTMSITTVISSIRETALGAVECRYRPSIRCKFILQTNAFGWKL